jgi:CBS domain-containing protein
MSLLPAGSPSTEGVTMSNRSFEGLDATLGAMHLRPPTVVSADDTLSQVASAMERDGVSCAILEEQPLRVVTEFDLTRALAQGLGPEDSVAAIASAHPRWAPPSASVAEAAALMVSLGIRHLVVLDRPSGLVSMAELFGVIVRSQEPMALYAKFADIMLHGDSEASNQVHETLPPRA